MRSLIFFSDDKSDTGLFEKIEKTLTNSTEGKKNDWETSYPEIIAGT